MDLDSFIISHDDDCTCARKKYQKWQKAKAAQRWGKNHRAIMLYIITSVPFAPHSLAWYNAQTHKHVRTAALHMTSFHRCMHQRGKIKGLWCCFTRRNAPLMLSSETKVYLNAANQRLNRKKKITDMCAGHREAIFDSSPYTERHAPKTPEPAPVALDPA